LDLRKEGTTISRTHTDANIQQHSRILDIKYLQVDQLAIYMVRGI